MLILLDGLHVPCEIVLDGLLGSHSRFKWGTMILYECVLATLRTYLLAARGGAMVGVAESYRGVTGGVDEWMESGAVMRLTEQEKKERERRKRGSKIDEDDESTGDEDPDGTENEDSEGDAEADEEDWDAQERKLGKPPRFWDVFREQDSVTSVMKVIHAGRTALEQVSRGGFEKTMHRWYSQLRALSVQSKVPFYEPSAYSVPSLTTPVADDAACLIGNKKFDCAPGKEWKWNEACVTSDLDKPKAYFYGSRSVTTEDGKRSMRVQYASVRHAYSTWLSLCVSF